MTAIAPRPTSRAVASSTSTGVAQSLEWSVCMCRSTSISLCLRDPRADLGLAGRGRGAARRGARRSPRPGRRPAPTRAPRAPRRRAATRPARRSSSRISRSSCSASTSTSPTWKCSAEVAVAQHLLVDRHARGERDRAGAERPHEHAGRGHLAERGRDDDVGGRERGVLVVDDVHAVAQAGAQRRDGAGLRVDDRLPRQLLRQQPQRAQEEPQRAALLAVGERDPQRRAVGLLAAARRVTPGAQQLGRTPGSSGSAAPPSPRSSRCARPCRPKNSSTNLRATWVLSTRSAGAWKEPTFSARLCRSATLPALGAHGSCTCTKSSGATDSTSSIVRAMSTGGAGLMPLRPRGEQQLADAEHAHAAVGVEQRLRLLPRGPDQLARLAHERGRPRRREQQHAVPARGQLPRDLGREGPDLVRILERMRRDLGDGEAVSHCAELIGAEPALSRDPR